MFSITIRQAGLSDIPTIHDMAEIVFRHTYAPYLSPEQLDYMMEWMYSPDSLEDQISIKGHTYYIAWHKDTPTGYVSFNEDAPAADGTRIFHLQKIYILPEFQRKGIGSRLFDYVVARIHERGGQRIELNVNRNNPAMQFYRHKGMKIARKGDFPIGHNFFMNDYIMSIDL